MSSCRTLCIGSLVLLIVIAGCGCGGGYNENNVTVTVSPAGATISGNGQVTLRATVKGLCSGCAPSIDLWSVAEDVGESCDWYTMPPTGQCPGGTIQETAGAPSNTLTVKYHAPGTPGTYHVIAQCCGGGLFGGLPPFKQGTSVITVTP